METINPTPETANVLPIRDAIGAWLLAHVTPTQHEAIKAALASIVSETDGFVRSGNRTAYNLDELAFSSARVEPVLGLPGSFDFNYSTMKGRRVQDIARAFLLHVASFIFPDKKREDGKLNHQIKPREIWVAERGFRKEAQGKGNRWMMFGDYSAELIATLEPLVPEHFEGTQQPKNAKVSIILVAPSAAGAFNVYLSVYKAGTPEQGIVEDVKKVVELRKLGFTLSNTDKNEHSKLYAEASEAILAAVAAEAAPVVEEQPKKQRKAA